MNREFNITFETIAASGRALLMSGAAGTLVGLIAGMSLGVCFFIWGALYGGVIGIPIGFSAGALGAAIGGRRGCTIAGAICGAIGGCILGAALLGPIVTGVIGLISGLVTGLIVDRWLNRVEAPPGMFLELKDLLADTHLYDLPLGLRLGLASFQIVPFVALVAWIVKVYRPW